MIRRDILVCWNLLEPNARVVCPVTECASYLCHLVDSYYQRDTIIIATLNETRLRCSVSSAEVNRSISEQMVKVIWRRPHRIRAENGDTRPWIPKNLYHKQDLDPFSRFATHAHNKQRFSDTPRYRSLSAIRNRTHLMHSMQ